MHLSLRVQDYKRRYLGLTLGEPFERRQGRIPQDDNRSNRAARRLQSIVAGGAGRIYTDPAKAYLLSAVSVRQSIERLELVAALRILNPREKHDHDFALHAGEGHLLSRRSGKRDVLCP
jgi:hypothetical protein